MVSPALEILGVEMPRLAKRAARESGNRLMVHIGDTTGRYDPTVIRELLPLLEPGDILSHLFTANPGGVLDSNGKLSPSRPAAPSSPSGAHTPGAGSRDRSAGPTCRSAPADGWHTVCPYASNQDPE